MDDGNAKIHQNTTTLVSDLMDEDDSNTNGTTDTIEKDIVQNATIVEDIEKGELGEQCNIDRTSVNDDASSNTQQDSSTLRSDDFSNIKESDPFHVNSDSLANSRHSTPTKGINMTSKRDSASKLRENERDEYDSDMMNSMDDVDTWYQKTFSNELEKIKISLSPGDDSVKLDEELSSSPLHLGNWEDPSRPRRASSTSVDNLEQKLQEALAYAQKEESEKLALQRRLTALESLEELRTPERGKRVDGRSNSFSKPKLQPVHGVIEQHPWDADADHSTCYQCSVAFSFTNRRHHCRNCGHIFCESCAPSANKAPIPRLGFHNPVRHCLSCLPNQSNATSTRSNQQSQSIKILKTSSASRANNVACSPILIQSSAQSFDGDVNAFESHMEAAAGRNGNLDSQFHTFGGTITNGSTDEEIISYKSNQDLTPGEWIDEILKIEGRVTREPTPAGVLSVIDIYRTAIESLSSADVEYSSDTSANSGEFSTLKARRALVENMHSFLELPNVKQCLPLRSPK